jgi:hypothetical protein
MAGLVSSLISWLSVAGLLRCNAELLLQNDTSHAVVSRYVMYVMEGR